MPWLTPNDLARALIRALLLLAVPLIASLRGGLSVARILTVLSFGAAIAGACWCEAWARGAPERRARVGERALLVAYAGAWLPVLEVLYLRNAPGVHGPSGLAHLFAPTPETWVSLLLAAVGLVPVASALAAGSMIHSHAPFAREPGERPWGRVLGFALRQGLVCALLALGLSSLPELGLSALGALGALALGGLSALAILIWGVSLAAIYLCCDACAAVWIAPTPGPSADSSEAPHAKISGSTETLIGQ